MASTLTSFAPSASSSRWHSASVDTVPPGPTSIMPTRRSTVTDDAPTAVSALRTSCTVTSPLSSWSSVAAISAAVMVPSRLASDSSMRSCITRFASTLSLNCRSAACTLVTARFKMAPTTGMRNMPSRTARTTSMPSVLTRKSSTSACRSRVSMKASLRMAMNTFSIVRMTRMTNTQYSIGPSSGCTRSSSSKSMPPMRPRVSACSDWVRLRKAPTSEPNAIMKACDEPKRTTMTRNANPETRPAAADSVSSSVCSCGTNRR
mmetsp:Transcript_162/g.539  ORF Transcript_162/g.539 Transcript_162/m.539 type:complete len:262 (-) Transcript_162:953-1738(-)